MYAGLTKTIVAEKAPFLRPPCDHTIAWCKINSHPHRTRCCVLR